MKGATFPRANCFYRPPTKLREGNVFTGVCPGGGWVSLVPCPFHGVSLVPGPFERGWVCPGGGYIQRGGVGMCISRDTIGYG